MLRNSREWRSIPIDRLKPYGKHLRRHSRKKIDKLKKLIEHFGQVAPVLVNAENVIIDGHAVWQVVRELGAGEIGVISIEGRSDFGD